MGAEDVIQRFDEVQREVKAVGHLGGLWGARVGAVNIRFQAISGDNSDTRLHA
jgi:hypothetical protein